MKIFMQLWFNDAKEWRSLLFVMDTDKGVFRTQANV